MNQTLKARVLAATVAVISLGAVAACDGPGGPLPGPPPPPNTFPKPCDDCHGDDPGEPGYPGTTVAPSGGR